MSSNIQQIALSKLPLAAIDFESAGCMAGQTDQPVQIGILRADALLAAPETYVSYIACNRPVHWSAAKVHGITTQDLAYAPSMSNLWPEIKTQLRGRVLIGHNPSTEQRFLAAAFPGHGFGPYIDTLALARKVIPDAPNYSLGEICEGLGLLGSIQALVPAKRWHDALFDAAASFVLLRHIILELEMQDYCLKDIAFAVK